MKCVSSEEFSHFDRTLARATFAVYPTLARWFERILRIVRCWTGTRSLVRYTFSDEERRPRCLISYVSTGCVFLFVIITIIIIVTIFTIFSVCVFFFHRENIVEFIIATGPSEEKNHNYDDDGEKRCTHSLVV